MAKKLKVLLLFKQQHDLRDHWVTDLLEALGSRHQLVEYDYSRPPAAQFAGVDAVIDQGGGQGTREMADHCGSVKLWQVLGTGFDQLDIDYWRKKGIPVANTPGVFSAVPLAEAALMYMIMLVHKWHPCQENLRRGVFFTPFGDELDGKRLLLFGFGASAQQLAKRARAFGMEITAVDIRNISEQEKREYGLAGAFKPAELDDLIPECDFLSLHLHLNAETRGIIDRRRIGLMKPGAYLINVARGPLVDQDALYRALAEGRLAGAGLDVFATEPMDPNDPLLKLPNLVATPHTSGTTRGTSKRRAVCVRENLERVAQGLEPLHRVDIPAPAMAKA